MTDTPTTPLSALDESCVAQFWHIEVPKALMYAYLQEQMMMHLPHLGPLIVMSVELDGDGNFLIESRADDGTGPTSSTGT